MLKACAVYLLDPVSFYGSDALLKAGAVPQEAVLLIQADAENRRLREEMKSVAVLKEEAQALKLEVGRLKTLLGFRPERGRVVRWAPVIERDPANWHRFLSVSAGEEDGVQMNAPVLGVEEAYGTLASTGARLAAVGKVVEVHPRTSRVLLLTDELSSAAVQVASTPWEGLLEGAGAGGLRVNYLPVEANLAAGLEIWTSETSATFPAGILVGRIDAVLPKDPFIPFQSVRVRPEVQPYVLKEVLILVPDQEPPPSGRIP